MAGQDAISVAEQVRENMVAGGFLQGSGKSTVPLRPLFLSEADYDRLRAASRVALDLVGRAELEVRSDVSLRGALFGIHPYADAIEAHLGHEIEPVGRFDLLVDRSGAFRFIEYNAGLCGGAFASDKLAGLFVDLPTYAAVAAVHPLRFEPLGGRYWDALTGAYRAARGHEPKSLAIILPPGTAEHLWRSNVELNLIIGHAGDAGLDARFTRLDELHEEAEALFDEVGPIHVAIVADWQALLAACPQTHALWRPHAPAGTWLFNSLGASSLRAGKHLLAVLSDPDYDLPLKDSERSWIAAHIPWTRIVRPGSVLIDGARHDLLSWARANRKNLVVKPCFSMGGRGVGMGWTTSQLDWETALEQALASPSVLQARVNAPARPWPVATHEGIRTRRFDSDLCVFTWNGGEVGGVMCRLSAGGKLNFSAGAMLTPVFIQ